MDQLIELTIKDLRPDFISIIFNMALSHLKNLSPAFEEMLKESPFPKLPEVPVAITNFNVFFALESARRHFATSDKKFNYPEYLPANLERFQSPDFVFREFCSMLKKFSKEFNDEHIKDCPIHQVEFVTLWYAFVKALLGGDFASNGHSIGIGMIIGIPEEELSETPN